MIDLTPLEVRQKKGDFSKGLRGYDIGEVDDFLALVADRLEALVKENMGLKDRLGRMEEQLTEFKQRERALTDALVTAQQMREEVRKQSSREAEILMKEARQEAERVRATALQRIEKEEEMLRRLRARQGQLIQTFRGFLERELNELAVVAEAIGAGEEEESRAQAAPPKKAAVRKAPARKEAPPAPPAEPIRPEPVARVAPAEPSRQPMKPRTPHEVISGPEDLAPAAGADAEEEGAPEDLLPREPHAEEPEEREPEAEGPETETEVPETETEPALEAGGGPEESGLPFLGDTAPEPARAPATPPAGLPSLDLGTPDEANPAPDVDEADEVELESAPARAPSSEDDYDLAMEIEAQLEEVRGAEGGGDERMPWEEEPAEAPDPWAEELDFGPIAEGETGGARDPAEQLELAGDDAGEAPPPVEEEEEEDEPDWLSSILKEKP